MQGINQIDSLKPT